MSACLKSKNCSAPCERCRQRPEVCHIDTETHSMTCGACCPTCRKAAGRKPAVTDGIFPE
jgi:hypothetical protein